MSASFSNFFRANRSSSKSKNKKDDTQSTRKETIKGSKITKRVNVSSSSINAKKTEKRTWSFFDLLKISGHLQTPKSEYGFEGDTLVDDDLPIKSEGGDQSEVTAAVEKTLFEPFGGESDSCLPFGDRAFHPDDKRIQDWSDDEVWIFNRLVMRGQEPLLSYELASEFPSWPDVLFTKDHDQVVISNINRSTINLASAINRFLYEGVSVRCRLQATRNVEPPIERALRGLHKFIMQDGNLRLKGSPSLICVAAAAPNEDVAHVVERCVNKMYRAGRQWRNWLTTKNNAQFDGCVEGQQFAARLPTICGYVVKHSVLAIMTWDSCLGDEEGTAKPVRTIGTYDWKIEGQDVWHALAVGIVECKARSYLLDLDRENLLGNDRVESDPDL